MDYPFFVAAGSRLFEPDAQRRLESGTGIGMKTAIKCLCSVGTHDRRIAYPRAYEEYVTNGQGEG